MTSAQATVTLEDDRLTLSGSIDPLTVVALRKEGERLILGSKTDLTVDLTAMSTAHSVVLSLLLCWQRLARRHSQNLHFSGVGERLASLAALSGLDDQLPGFPSQAPSQAPRENRDQS
ncbi:STAS domain-containing protein [Marinobacter orientalis]|uniref:STAS domain-containing protein n=1 Tax=Marinobacter orientalis TaxID=1928859 RepID=A0A7Y0WTS8_9GAMM|nr:STAS domain-containing protein [Marinobacter orientalis]NMT65187.1 STAS domain-containing protein [Marinobacter orientalis]TGX48042.1 STAS domain-containing protein [Marinobacter orientalis]